MIKKFLAFAVVVSSMGSACNGENTKTETTQLVTEGTSDLTESKSEEVSVPGNISGDMIIKGQFSVKPAFTKVYLWESEGKNKYLIDSVGFVENGFSFKKRTYSAGIYQIGFDKERNFTDLVLNPNEGDLDLSFNGPQIKSAISFPDSKENIAWHSYLREKGNLDAQVNQLRNQRNQTGNKDLNYTIESKMNEIIALQKKVAAENPGTFTAKILGSMSSPKKNDKAKYWDDIDFSDPTYIRSEVLNERIQEFMRTHSDGGKEQGYYNCIDIVTEKAKANQEVLEYMMYTMLDGFYMSNMENICAYMLDNVIYGDGCGVELSDFLLKRAAGVQNLRIGNVPPDFTIETHKGAKLTFSKEVKANKYTLLMFWSSWCHKCEEEIPQLLPIYAQYKPKGFQVIGVSIDHIRQQWIESVNKKGITFPTVCQLKGWDSPVAKDYRVTATPVMILLDKDMKIVAKPTRIFEVKSFLEQNLK